MDFILLILGLVMLTVGAEFVVRGSVSLGKKLKISLFAIGVVVVAARQLLPKSDAQAMSETGMFAGTSSCGSTVVNQQQDIREEVVAAV